VKVDFELGIAGTGRRGCGLWTRPGWLTPVFTAFDHPSLLRREGKKEKRKKKKYRSSPLCAGERVTIRWLAEKPG